MIKRGKSLCATMFLLLGLFGCTEQTAPPSPPNSSESIKPTEPSITTSAVQDGVSSPPLNNSVPPDDTWFEGQINEDALISVILGTYSDPVAGESNGTYMLTRWDEGFRVLGNPFCVNDVIMATLDGFMQRFGFEMQVNNADEYIIKGKYGEELILTIGSGKAVLNNIEVILDFFPIYRGGIIYIPLRCIAEYMGLYTTLYYSEYAQGIYFWVSESAVLNKSEYVPDHNFEFQEILEAYDDMGYYMSANVYTLKKNGQTYSGIQIGNSFDEVIILLGKPQYIEKDQNAAYYRITYDLYPEPVNDYIDSLQIVFAEGYVQEILLILHTFT